MAHRRSGRTFHKKTMGLRKLREAEREREESAKRPVVVRKMTPEELARFKRPPAATDDT